MTPRPLLLVCFLAVALPLDAQEPPAPTPAELEEQRTRALALNEQAVALYQAQEVAEALLILRQALELCPQEPALRTNAAQCLLALGDAHLAERRFEEAVRDYHEAGTLVPADPRPAEREALALHRGMKDRDAVIILERVVREQPERVKALDLLARCLYRLGEIARAVEHWEQATALDPENENRAKLLERARKEASVEGELYTDLGAAHFRIKYDGARDLALGKRVAQILETAYGQVGALLGRYPDREVSVVVYPEKTFRATTGAHGWVAGLYDGKIRVPARGLGQAPAHEVQRVLTHEYAHALLHAVGGGRVPVWLQEGFAQIAEGRTRADARRGLTRANAPSLDVLSRSFMAQRDPAAVRLLYAAACDLVHALLAQGGTPALADLLDRLGKNEPRDQALRWVYGQSLAELHAAWLGTLP